MKDAAQKDRSDVSAPSGFFSSQRYWIDCWLKMSLPETRYSMKIVKTRLYHKSQVRGHFYVYFMIKILASYARQSDLGSSNQKEFEGLLAEDPTSKSSMLDANEGEALPQKLVSRRQWRCLELGLLKVRIKSAQNLSRVMIFTQQRSKEPVWVCVWLSQIWEI